MDNEALKPDIMQLDSGEGPNRKWKQKVGLRRRDAFKAWQFSLLLNVPLLHTQIRHGMQEPTEMCQFMLAVEEERKDAKRRSTPCVEAVEELRRDALEARLTLRRAHNIAKSW